MEEATQASGASTGGMRDEKGHKISVKKSSSLSTDAFNGIIKEMKCIMALEMCHMHACFLTSPLSLSLFPSASCLTMQFYSCYKMHTDERTSIAVDVSFYSRNVQLLRGDFYSSLSLTALL
jgi:hypothetical protein